MLAFKNIWILPLSIFVCIAEYPASGAWVGCYHCKVESSCPMTDEGMMASATACNNKCASDGDCGTQFDMDIFRCYTFSLQESRCLPIRYNQYNTFVFKTVDRNDCSLLTLTAYEGYTFHHSYIQYELDPSTPGDCIRECFGRHNCYDVSFKSDWADCYVYGDCSSGCGNAYATSITYTLYRLSCSADCGSPGLISNAGLGLSTTTQDSVATYYCHAGYTMEGNNQRTCLENGSWSGSAPVCLRDCGAPEAINFGDVKYNSTAVYSTAQYVCNDNYDLDGEEFRVCEETGQWSDSPPTCEIDDTSSTASTVPTPPPNTTAAPPASTAAPPGSSAAGPSGTGSLTAAQSTAMSNVLPVVTTATPTTAPGTGTTNTPNVTSAAPLTTPNTGTTTDVPIVTIATTTTAPGTGTINTPYVTSAAPLTTPNTGTTTDVPIVTIATSTTAPGTGTTNTSNVTSAAPLTTPNTGNTTDVPIVTIATSTSGPGTGTTNTPNVTSAAPLTTPNTGTTTDVPIVTIATSTTAPGTGTTNTPNVTSAAPLTTPNTGTTTDVPIVTIATTTTAPGTGTTYTPNVTSAAPLTTPNTGTTSDVPIVTIATSTTVPVTGTTDTLNVTTAALSTPSAGTTSDVPTVTLITSTPTPFTGTTPTLLNFTIATPASTVSPATLATTPGTGTTTDSSTVSLATPASTSGTGPTNTAPPVATGMPTITPGPSITTESLTQPIYLWPCLCSNNSFSGRSQEEIIEELVADTQIDTESTLLSVSKLKCMDDPRESAANMGILGITLLGTVGVMMIVFDLMKYFVSPCCK